MTTTGDRPRRLQRISQACDLCHRRSIRCRPSAENAAVSCQNCYDFAVPCTYDRPSRRRRTGAPQTNRPPNVVPSLQHLLISPPVTNPASINPPSASNASLPRLSRSPDVAGSSIASFGSNEDDPLLVAWRSFASSNSHRIALHMESYMNYVYPIFPLFHGPSLWERLQRADYLSDQSFFASVMAACALAAARARDGAIPGFTRQPNEESESETFFTAAQAIVVKFIAKDAGIGVLQACLLLALTSIQYNDISTMHQFNGYGHTLCSMQHFHDEESWPSNLSRAEKEERRRLFWSMYQFDIYVSCVFQSMPRMDELYGNVCYPQETNDEQVAVAGGPTRQPTWLLAFNFTTELYRILALTLDRLRMNKVPQMRDRHDIGHLFSTEAYTTDQILSHVISFYYQQPNELRHFDHPVTGNHAQDILGFQIANIQATLQLLRMTLIEADQVFDGHQKCDIVRQVISTFRRINPHFLKAISTPLVYHLGRIGHILASVIQGPLTEDLYQQARQQLKALADLLEDLESGLSPTAGASRELRQQIEKIDQHMREQRQDRGSPRMPQVPHQQQPPPTNFGQMSEADPSSNDQTPRLPPMMTASAPYPTIANGGGMIGQQNLAVEFQLPPELTGVWPWPFVVQGDNSDHSMDDYGNVQE